MASNYSVRRKYKTARELQVEKVIQEIQNGLRVLVLMRGLPGSGKTTLAKDILHKGLGSTDYSTFIFSSDDYFTNQRTGQYRYDVEKIGDAHHYSKMRACSNMAGGLSPVIIDNTNTELWEMEAYIPAAAKYQYIIEIVEPNTSWAFKVDELAHRNTHNVPLRKLQKMLDRYDKTITVEKLLGMIGTSYIGPPQYRSYPPFVHCPSNYDLLGPPPTKIDAKNEDEVIIISDDEVKQTPTSPRKHNLNTAKNSLESEMKKARPHNGFLVNPPPPLTKTANEIQKARNFYPELNLSAWGLSEDAVSSWQSWDVVNPLQYNNENNIQPVEYQIVPNIVETADASTNTYGTDFFPESRSVKIKVVVARSRDINIGHCSIPSKIPPKRITFEKSSMTDEDLVRCEPTDIKNLCCLFPNIPVDDLTYILRKYEGNINGTVDLLLEDTMEFIQVFKPLDKSSNNNSSSSTHNTNMNLQANMQDLKINDSPCSKKATPALKQACMNDNQETFDISEYDMDDFPENEELIELNLGENFVSQLEAKLGFAEVMPKGFLPIVQVPISIARQLYATYVESILGQIQLQKQVLETCVEQDEAFALKLHKQEQAEANNKIPYLLDIMKEQAELKQTEEWKNETSVMLATKMALQKLVCAFPGINTQTLMEIYHAYGDSYEQTVEVLLESTEDNSVYDPDGTLMIPPVSSVVKSEMKEAEEHLGICLNTRDEPKSAQEYRDEANMHYKIHNELIKKAKQAYLGKQYQVAQFYSDLGKTHTQLFDQANNLAASAFLNEHSEKLQSFYTLDLHFLYVKEAVSALDIFIDTNIHLLNDRKPFEILFIITGRGKRSEQGKSKLKPVIMTRLRKRKIRYWELNPGLLKIRVLNTSPLTSNI